jgi:monoamine oxidase
VQKVEPKMTNIKPVLPTTRRQFLERMSMTMGTAAMTAALSAFGVQTASATERPPELTGSGKGKKIVILGAGWAGLVSAFELSKLGYECTVLEAHDYVGGRAQTGRKGTVLQLLGKEDQTVDFAEGEYLNYGPWRIPFNHRSTLYYTKLLNVPLETMVNANDASYVFQKTGPFAGKRVRQYEIKADVRGYTSELVAKAASTGKLDGLLKKDDEEAFVEYLTNEGFLEKTTHAYHGTDGRGFKVNPGAGVSPGPGIENEPYDFSDVLQSKLWRSVRSVGSWDQQNTMMQPVGGMDQTPRAFMKHIGDKVKLNSEVRKIRNTGKGVTVDYVDLKTGAKHQIKADYCICTIPISVLKNIDTNFSAPFKDAMSQMAYALVGKIGLQMKRRFWEEDDGIYGGHVFTDNEKIGLLSLPSYNLQGKTGTILGGYPQGAVAAELSAMSIPEVIETALASGAEVWPDQYRQNLQGSFAYFWHLSKYNLGGWGEWHGDSRQKAYPVLIQPEGHVYLAGEHLSYLGGWQAGAIESAWQQIEKVHKRATA